jgi:hypothetical protein
MRCEGPPRRPSFWSRWEIGDIRYQVQSGKYMLALSFSGFDPFRKSAATLARKQELA